MDSVLAGLYFVARVGGSSKQSAQAMDELCYKSALELRDLYNRREASPVEVAEAVLGRIDQLNPDLNAFITLTPERALDQARAAAQAYQKKEAGPLAGVPGSLKDLTFTKDIRTTRGSLLHQNAVPEFDAPVVSRLYGAGMVLLGKTNTPEFGWKGDSGNRVVGPTHNPWRRGCTAGGVERWRRSCGGGRHGPAGTGVGRRRLDSNSRRVQRHIRPEAVMGASASASGERGGTAFSHRSDDTDGAGCGSDADGHGASG